MTIALIYHRVADYDIWKREYDRIAKGPLASDVRAYRIWRGEDDPNLVVVAETFDSREVADAVFSHPELADEIASAGVEMESMQIHFLDEVASGP